MAGAQAVEGSLFGETAGGDVARSPGLSKAVSWPGFLHPALIHTIKAEGGGVVNVGVCQPL